MRRDIVVIGGSAGALDPLREIAGEEQAAVAKVMASRAAKIEDAQAAERFEMRPTIAEENARDLRQVLLDRADDVADELTPKRSFT